MAQTEFEVRVRPTRAAILLARTASQEQFLLAVRFLSRLWGGRHCPILPVESAAQDAKAKRWLSKSRPDLVYGIGVDDDVWRVTVRSICQPRGYGRLTPEFVDGFFLPHGYHQENLISLVPVLRRLRNEWSAVGNRPIQLLGCRAASPLYPLAECTFGHFDPLGRLLPSDEGNLDQNATPVDFINRYQECLQRHRTWLDLTSYGLHTWTGIEALDGHQPTIILVDSVPLDLALFWTLRTSAAAGIPKWIIPVRIGDAWQADVLDALSRWVDAYTPFRLGPPECMLLH